MALQFTRVYTGPQKIFDRKKSADGSSYVEVPVVLHSKDGYSPITKITQTEINGEKIRKAELVYGKPFQVNDEEFVLSRHSAILKRV